jgi:hypothetical protein
MYPHTIVQRVLSQSDTPYVPKDVSSTFAQRCELNVRNPGVDHSHRWHNPICPPPPSKRLPSMLHKRMEKDAEVERDSLPTSSQLDVVGSNHQCKERHWWLSIDV